MTAHPLADQFRQIAATLRESGASQAADVWDVAAARVETYERTRALERLSLAVASEESGYSLDHLGYLIKTGVVPNAGEKYSPRILRRDLPRKPGGRVRSSNQTAAGEPDLVSKSYGRRVD